MTNDTPILPVRTLQTPLGVRHFQPVGNGLWFVMDSTEDGESKKAIEAPHSATDKDLIHALMKATAVW